MGNGASTGSINPVSAVTNNGVLAFNQPGTYTFLNNIGGSGGVTQMGGVLQLAGVNTYTGPTVISGGTLQDVARGAIIHLTMNAPAGTINIGDTVPDTGGYFNNGTMVNNAASYVTGGPNGNNAIQFTGNQVVVVPNSAAMQVTAWTTNIWINGTGDIINNRNFNAGSGHDSYGFDLSYNGSSINMSWANTGGGWDNYPNVSASLSAGWHMITEAVDSSGWQLYVDGSSIGSGGNGSGTPIFIEPWLAGVGIGGPPTGSFSGQLADFSLYGQVLTQAQITGLFSGESYTFGGSLPVGTPMQIAHGAVYDLAGVPVVTLGSLSDLNGGGGTGDHQRRRPGGPYPGRPLAARRASAAPSKTATASSPW